MWDNFVQRIFSKVPGDRVCRCCRRDADVVAEIGIVTGHVVAEIGSVAGMQMML